MHGARYGKNEMKKTTLAKSDETQTNYSTSAKLNQNTFSNNFEIVSQTYCGIVNLLHSTCRIINHRLIIIIPFHSASKPVELIANQHTEIPAQSAGGTKYPLLNKTNDSCSPIFTIKSK